MKTFKNILLYLWQLPQNLVGLILRIIYKGQDSIYESAIVRRSTNMSGGISLGKYIIVSQWSQEKTIQHEWGHCRQSMYLGWLYLLVIGLPSIIWAGLYGSVIKATKNGYYKFFTEKWANKLGGVEQ
jgi:hypothetical protein